MGQAPIQSPQRHEPWAIQTMMQIPNIEYYAHQDLPMLITGEIGTGKSYTAHSLHSLSPRKTGPFVTIHCRDDSGAKALECEIFGCEKASCDTGPSDQQGKLELADKGTLVFENLDELSLDIQGKICVFLKFQSFQRVKGKSPLSSNVRVLGTSRKDPQKLLAPQMLHPQLFSQLHQLHIHLPRLAAQKDGVGEIASALLPPIARQMDKKILGFSSEVENFLESYTWPGNLRQLQNILKRAVILEESKWIQLNSLFFPEINSPKTNNPSLNSRC
ncbi:MAG: sigma 54-interacting transcriptional regulator [Desulfovermiculus sp.]|nr:sigma 54-interacting transcriptional regulator [Desulfovermiculus sp.]